MLLSHLILTKSACNALNNLEQILQWYLEFTWNNLSKKIFIAHLGNPSISASSSSGISSHVYISNTMLYPYKEDRKNICTDKLESTREKRTCKSNNKKSDKVSARFHTYRHTPQRLEQGAAWQKRNFPRQHNVISI